MARRGFSSWFQRECVGAAERECSGMAGSGFQLDRHLQLDERVARESGNADGGAHVAARFSEQLDEKVRRAVDHFRGIVKASDGIHVTVYRNDLFHRVERSEVLL